MVLYCVEDSIIAATMAMKARNQIEMDEITDDPGRKNRLTVDDLTRLFVKVGENPEGEPSIFAQGDNQYDNVHDPTHPCLLAMDDDDDEMGSEG